MKKKRKVSKKIFILFPLVTFLTMISVGFSSWIIQTKINKQITGNVDANVGNVVQYSDSVNVVFLKYTRNYDYMGSEIIKQEVGSKGDTYNPVSDTTFIMKDEFSFVFRNKKTSNIRIHIRFTVNVEGIKNSMQPYLRPQNTIGHNFGWFHRSPLDDKQKKAPVKFTRYLSNEKTQKIYIEDNINLSAEETITLVFTVYPNNYYEIIDKILTMSGQIEVNNVTKI